MIRIGVLGTDNSHSITFSKLFNVPGEKYHIAGAKVVAVYGLEDARNKEVAEKAQIPTIVRRPADMLGMIDGAIVDFRHGSRHLKYARPFIEAGIPTFIDKPFAATVADAKKMVALARRKHVPITSFSTVRFGPAMLKFKKAVKDIGKVRAIIISGPGNARDQYDGIFFYAVHQVELMLEVFGNAVKSARGLDRDGLLVGEVVYKNGMVATMHEINSGWAPFAATAFGAEGTASYDATKFDNGYFVGAKAFTEMFRTGKMPYSYNDILVSTRVLAAIQKSIDTGGKDVLIR